MTAIHAISASSSLIKIANWDGESQGISHTLTAAFGADDYLECIKDLRVREIDPLSYIDNLDKVSYSIPNHYLQFITIW